MPSDSVLKQKQAIVASLTDELKNAASVVLVDYKGINVENDTKLRAELRSEDVNYSVVKNTLLRRACEQAGLNDLIPSLEGTTALALSADEVAPARIINKYAVKSKDFFNMKVGYVGGKFMNADDLKALAMLPSREALIAQTAGALNGIIASLARGLSEVAKLQETA